MWVCDKREGGDGEVYLIESEEGYQEMSVRLQVAVMLDYVHVEMRELRECWRRCAWKQRFVIA